MSKKSGNIKKTGLLSWKEIEKRTQCIFLAPLEWIANLAGIDVPHPHTESQQHRRSRVHVRLRMDTSEIGDILSHSWLPPVQMHSKKPPFDSEIVFSLLINIHKQTEHFFKFFEFCEDAIKWDHPSRVCVAFYFVVAAHMYFAVHLIILLHVYLLLFLASRFCKLFVERSKTLWYTCRSDSRSGSVAIQPPDKPLSSETKDASCCTYKTNHEHTRTEPVHTSHLSENSFDRDVKNKEETARLNAFVRWIAQRFGDNKGLEVLQFKLTEFKNNITVLNSFWNGRSTVRTLTAFLVLLVSLLLHFILDRRLLWISGTMIAYFGSSPGVFRLARFCFGLNYGVTQMLRRKHFHETKDWESHNLY